MPKIAALLLVQMLALNALAADGNRIDVVQLDVKPTVISPASAPVVAAAPAPEPAASARPKAGKKKAAKAQAAKKPGHKKAAKKSRRARR